MQEDASRHASTGYVSFAPRLRFGSPRPRSGSNSLSNLRACRFDSVSQALLTKGLLGLSRVPGGLGQRTVRAIDVSLKLDACE